ncbi:MAG: tryptophan-rich sensory protein [Patescibacteria group bacterium]
MKLEINFRFVLPFLLNLIANFCFSYLQFTLKNYLFAFVDILIIIATIIRTLKLVWNKYRWV